MWASIARGEKLRVSESTREHGCDTEVNHFPEGMRRTQESSEWRGARADEQVLLYEESGKETPPLRRPQGQQWPPRGSEVGHVYCGKEQGRFQTECQTTGDSAESQRALFGVGDKKRVAISQLRHVKGHVVLHIQGHKGDLGGLGFLSCWT